MTLDLRRGRLGIAPSIDAIPRSEREGGRLLTSPWVRGCAVAGSLLPNVKFVVPATLDGHAAVLELDTGAETSSVRVSSSAGEALDARAEPTREAAGVGSSTSARVARGTAIAVGDVTMNTDVKLVTGDEELACPSDGLLGMDVLKRCTLVLTRLQAVVRCDP